MTEISTNSSNQVNLDMSLSDDINSDVTNTVYRQYLLEVCDNILSTGQYHNIALHPDFDRNVIHVCQASLISDPTNDDLLEIVSRKLDDFIADNLLS